MNNQKIEQYIDEIYELYRGVRDINEELGQRMLDLTDSNKTNAKKLEKMLNEARAELQEYRKTTKAISGSFDIMKNYITMFIIYGAIFIVIFAIAFFFYFKSFKKEMMETIRDTYALHEKVSYITAEQYKILIDMEKNYKDKKRNTEQSTKKAIVESNKGTVADEE